MFNNKKRLVIASICGLLSSQAFAGLYVQGQAGAAKANAEATFFDNVVEKDSWKATGRISAGYLWHASPCLQMGVETGFQGYANLTVEDAFASFTYKRNTFDVLGVVDYSPNQKVNLFAKAGPAYAMQKYSFSLTDYPDFYDVDVTRKLNVVVPKAAVGIGYNINPALNVNLSWNREFKRESDTKFASDESAILAGVVFKYS